MDEPRIIAHGRWEQDEYGDTTYIPEHIRPSYLDDIAADRARDDRADPDADAFSDRDTDATGYRIRSDPTWDAARRDYLAGDTAEAVCARYDLRLGTLRHRAAQEGWRRSDAPDPEPLDLEAELADGLPEIADMARHALVRLNRAILKGRAPEAAAWLRIHRSLTEACATAPTPTPIPPTPPAPDPVITLDRQARALAALARDAARLDPDDAEGRAAIEARLDALPTLAPRHPISDDSDDSDPSFSAPGSERPPTDPESPRPP